MSEETGVEASATHVAAEFYAGRYARVLAATLDSPRGAVPAADAGFVVGALAFVGRLPEAEVLLAGLARPRTHTAARALASGGFFVCVALGRAGRHAEAIATLARAARDTRGARDAWTYALLHQGAACCRYFRGQYAQAARAATRALASAQRAEFPYGQMLANDMRGHLLIQTGRFRDGLATLERARSQAQALAFDANAHAIEVSLELTRARLARPGAARDALAALLAREGTHDGYSRREVLLDLAVCTAWAGEASAAHELLERHAAARCGDDDVRARVALLCARAQLARVREGFAAACALAREAAALLAPDADLARHVEVAAVLLGAARVANEPADASRAADWLARLAREHGLYLASAWAWVHGERAVHALADMDERTPLLARVARGDVASALDAGLLGLLPEALGCAPGKRIHAFEHAAVIEQHGDVAVRGAFSRLARALLGALHAGPCTREALLGAVWGLKGYKPERHDSLIKTTVSRLRASLGAARAWVQTDAAGRYHLAPGVEFVDHTQAHGAARAITAAATDDDDPRRDAPAAALAYPPRWRGLLALIHRAGEASVSELARRTDASLRTTSRDLAAMHARGLLGRAGAGRGTRYFALEASALRESTPCDDLVSTA